MNGITSKMIEFHRIAYKHAYKSVVKIVQEILYQKIGSLYEIFYGEWFSYKVFMASNFIEIL